MDPAAWLIHLELDQHDLKTVPLVSPLGVGIELLTTQVFDRTSVRVAVTLLPQLLYRVETEAVLAWAELLQKAEIDPNLNLALQQIASGTLSQIGLVGGTGDEAPEIDGAAQLATAQELLAAVLDSAIKAGPPDSFKLQSLRFSLMSSMPAMDPSQRLDAADMLRMATLLDCLHDRRFLTFTEGLLTIVAGLLETRSDASRAGSVIAEWLRQVLPSISDAYARPFAEVDPRINASVAAAYDVVQNLEGVLAGEADLRPFRAELGDAVSQIVLKTPDLGYYYDQPVRKTIAEEIDVCTSIAAVRDEEGKPTLTREQFDGCLESLTQLAENETRTAELAGDPDGPFGDDQLRRELALTPWQRINYGIGFMHDRYETGCEPPGEPLPNPLEWATAVFQHA
jgi:hypothetical protein